MSLDRFHSAQSAQSSGYASALAEIRRGRKASHWIWYIFPQIDGLGRSSTARAYALRDVAEAHAYLGDPTLRGRYEEIVAAVAKQLGCGVRLEELMGGSTDAMKVASSLTLFHAAAQRLASEDPTLAALAERCDAILKQTAAQGFGACAFTLRQISNASPK